ncbi:hypothetical protein EHEL_101040 [Encephalitozoon hellem ATCC 50504]|uniref:CLASP N-terminal domain-containing protein n=1 Tax=Encephalitozoon hellem TaxID=27973 RepID=A0A9Q9FAE7_ENCHE|nr:uncharacterized protein EHEL_101040 [Encephalitozoon hellem ATCC 50504]AFM99197.1 hypothetical protein EHEL_101040 [Encephalitozoon hellem ATCC 50504]UTX44182.1 hypothetical protein GPU96_10g19720 [Encephalitozoon hellem]|eukprot:XP_003888178.1 hypothetical protein EHEL_101040 [Encephalitozoon hellem ATCC 50504]
MSLDEIIKEAVGLQQRKEDENTWSKINDALLRLAAGVRCAEEARKVLGSVEELIVRSMQSDRSRLAGSALGLLKSCISILGSEFEAAGQYLGPLAKVCGKSSRVFYSRGEDVLVELCKNVNIKAHARFFNEYSSCANKNVRVAIFKGIEAWGEAFSGIELFEGLVAKGRKDAFSDVRDVCKRMAEKFGLEGERKEKGNVCRTDGENLENGMKKGPVRMVRKPIRVGHMMMNEMEGRGVEKKELVPRFSPMRKQTRTGDGDYDKIKELSRQVKDIASDIKPDARTERSGRYGGIANKIKEMVCGESGRSGVVHPELIGEASKKVISHEDLTPMKLDRYLSKYREEHGNLGHKKESETSMGFEVKDTEVGEECMKVDERKNETTECKELDECGVDKEEDNKKEKIVVEDESFVEEMVESLDDGNEACAEMAVGELSKSLANISINEGDGQGEDGRSFPSAPSENPYENATNDRDIENSFKEYTIMESTREENERNCEEDGRSSGSKLWMDCEGSIGESSIPMDCEVENEKKRKDRKKALEIMKGNRFAGLLELSESSGEETVFSGKNGSNDDGGYGEEDAGEFTMMDSFVEVKKGVFRKR